MFVFVRVAEPGGDHVRRRAVRDADIELAGIGLGVGDQLRHVAHRDVLAGDHDVGDDRHEADRREVLQRIVAGTAVERGADRHRGGAADEQRVAVGLRRCGRAAGERAAGARAIVDDHLLAERGRQLLADQPPHDIDRAAGRERHDQPDRARGILVLRVRDARCDGHNEQEVAAASSCSGSSFFMFVLSWS